MGVNQNLNMEAKGKDNGHCSEDNMDLELGSTCSNSTLTAMSCMGDRESVNSNMTKVISSSGDFGHLDIVFQPAKVKKSTSHFNSLRLRQATSERIERGKTAIMENDSGAAYAMISLEWIHTLRPAATVESRDLRSSTYERIILKKRGLYYQYENGASCSNRYYIVSMIPRSVVANVTQAMM
ncbi:hypothetical protein Cgig2_030760 [Carnegiea gigantea]|uniref:Uncharacterized protein n=1 Tax=Carnegiea gigantea TaxID=171969 RepID=A0A9Q1QP17_9CARY|nr:hypothetical protein Cgig2_030760 [Carnegiea gigantea]